MIFPVFDLLSFLLVLVLDCVTSAPLPKETFRSLNLMLKALAPMVEKLSLRLVFIASMAVMMPTKAMIPNAMMATVMPVRSLLPRTVLHAKARLSMNFMA
jgi:hypothetical protein